MDQPAAAPAAQPSFLQMLITAEPWGYALFAALDGRSRLALAHTSPDFRHWVLTAAAHATISLLAYGGLSEAAWQRRFARAQQALALRAQHGRADNTLVVRVPTPSPAALQALRSIPASAGSAVTGLQLLQNQSYSGTGPSEGVHTLWLRGVGAAFPNLRSLRVSRLAGCLPHPTHLSHLIELQVCLCPAEVLTGQAAAAGPEPAAGPGIEQLIDSIAPFVPQLTTLEITNHGWHSFWPQLLTTTTTSLQRLAFDTFIDDQCVELICKRAPALQHISCPYCQLRSDFSSRTWSVRELRSTSSLYAVDLANLPQSPEGLLLQPDGRPGILHLTGEAQGLSEEVTQRLQQWQIAAPCRVHVKLPSAYTSDMISAAFQQLAAWLPAGAVLELDVVEWSDSWVLTQAAAGPMAAAAEHYSHVTIVAPAIRRKDLAALVRHQPAIQHASLYFGSEQSEYSREIAQAPWPWQSLHVRYLGLSDILYLPDPSAGQYELHVESLCSDHSYTENQLQLTPELRERLLSRLQHLTIYFSCPARLSIEPRILEDGYRVRREGSPEQPASLRSFLQLLSGCRLHCTQACKGLDVYLRHWTLTPSLITEFANLPSFPVPCTLVFSECEWLPSSECYSKMARVVPACYTTWRLDGRDSGKALEETIEHYKAICSGASARGGYDMLRLQVCRPHNRRHTDAQRSDVEAHIDQQGLGRWVDTEWVRK